MATYQFERLPVVIAADPGTRISLQSILNQAFGPNWSFDPGGSVLARSTASISYTEPQTGHVIEFGHWNPQNKVDGYFLIDGSKIDFGQSTLVSDFAKVDVVAGNATSPLISIAVHNSFGSGKESVFTWYNISIVPTATFSGSTYSASPSDIVAKALQFAEVYKNVPLPDDCDRVADAIAASVGAPMPSQNNSINPAENREGGLWRIVHRGSDTPTADWQKLLKAGDVIRVDWTESSFHTATVIEAENSNGRIRVVDNIGPNGEIAVRTVDFEPAADPKSITIYRISEDQLYLLAGSNSGEKLNGTTRADDLRGLGGNDILTSGSGDDKIIPGSGDDVVDGGAGTDVVWLNALKASVKVSSSADGKTVLTSVDGRDTLTNVELVHFSDGQVAALSSLGPPAPAVSTMPATALSQFVMGGNPTVTELEARAAAASAAYDYYANVLKVANPALGPYESLGVSFSATSAFQAKFGSDSSSSFVSMTYDEVFHRSPSAGQQNAFQDQLAYFAGIYQRAGVAPGVAEMQARGAVLGQMIGYVMTDQNEASRSGQTIDDKVQAYLGSLPVSVVGQSASIEML